MRFFAAEPVAAAEIDFEALADLLPRVDPSRVRVWSAPWWFRMMWAKGITAVAMPWGIYVHPARLDLPMADLGPLMVHELSHIEQFRRLGPWGWARSYFGDYLRGRRTGLDHRQAYRQIGLEVEARGNAARLAP